MPLERTENSGLFKISMAVYNMSRTVKNSMSSLLKRLNSTTEKTDELARPLLRSTQSPASSSFIASTSLSRLNIFFKSLFPLQRQIRFQMALLNTAPFLDYIIQLPQGHPLKGLSLMDTTKRPVNFLLEAFFAGSGLEVVQPGQGLFAWISDLSQVAQFIQDKATQSPQEIIRFSAQGKPAIATGKSIADMSTVFGTNWFEISRKEVNELLKSQKVYTTSILPLSFYRELKKAMKEDHLVLLPMDKRGDDVSICLKDI